MRGEFRGRYPCQASVRLTRKQQEELRGAIELGFKPMVKRLRGDHEAAGRSSGPLTEVG